MATTSFAFTEAKIRNLKPPDTDDPNTRDYHKDAKCLGLQVAVFPSGKRVFYFVRRIDGRPTRVRLGTTDELSVDQAREAARIHAGDVAAGRNPQAARRAKREEAKLSDLWTSYLDLHAKPRKKSWKDDERQWEKYMGALAGKRLSAITKAVVAKWHGDIAKDHGPIQANRCKALLATMFSKGSDAVGYSGPNPCIGVANFPERSRERFLLPAEMEAFFKSLAAEDAYWQAFFLLCLFTGSRRGNIASMEWPEIDLANAVWHIPAAKTKNKRPTSIALCAPALAILTTRHQQRNGSPFVFPAFKGHGHLSDPRKAWNRILAGMRRCPTCNEIIGRKPEVCPTCKATLPPAEPMDLHMHDLRRTQGSWQAAMGISLAIIGKSLGHADLKSTQVYSRLQLDPVREAVSGASAKMIETAGVAIGGDGIKLLAAPAADPQQQ